MDEEGEVIKSLGVCELCNHNVYEDKSYPSWMACYCAVYKLKVPPPPPVPPQYYVDC